MNWKPGPAKTRDGREARIYAVDGCEPFPIHGAIQRGNHWTQEHWTSDGLNMGAAFTSSADLLPPKLSRDEVVAQCVSAYMANSESIAEDMRAALDHYDHLRKEGLCDE